MKVFCIPDLHMCWTKKTTLNRVIKLIKKEKPDVVIQLGDALDFFMFSRYDRTANLTTPEAELNKSLAMLKEFWREIRKAVPKAKCYQLQGNHEARLVKTILRKAPELMSLTRTIKDLYDFEGVKVLESDRDHLEIEGIVYCHGFLGKSEKHIYHFNKSVVHGHLHRPSLVTKGKLWAMDCGHLADESQLPLQYGASKVTNWAMAVGIVENKQPRLILL